MQKAKVKWFNATRGYGFITPDSGGPDAFVHLSAVERAGYDTLREGEKVQYDLVRGNTQELGGEPEARHFVTTLRPSCTIPARSASRRRCARR